VKRWKTSTRLHGATSQETAIFILAAAGTLNPTELKAATNFAGQKSTVISRLKEAGLRARHAAVKAALTDEHQLYRLAFAESSVDRQWDRVMFSDESTFSSANDRPVLVYRSRGERYNFSVFIDLHTQLFCVCSLLGLDLP
jgi:hypothetical protein